MTASTHVNEEREGVYSILLYCELCARCVHAQRNRRHPDVIGDVVGKLGNN
jgi:hypothetical protein